MSFFSLFSLGKDIGHQKEQQAKKWLQKQGMTIIAENFHCKGGEIDLIGLKNKQITFFEVKYRKSAAFGHPAEMVNYKKQQHIILCAQKYLQKNPQYQDYGFQFDVITFSGEQTEPEWIQNAFEGI